MCCLLASNSAFNNPDQKHDIFKCKVNKQLVNVTKVTIYIYCSGYKGILQTLDLQFTYDDKGRRSGN